MQVSQADNLRYIQAMLISHNLLWMNKLNHIKKVLTQKFSGFIITRKITRRKIMFDDFEEYDDDYSEDLEDLDDDIEDTYDDLEDFDDYSDDDFDDEDYDYEQ